MAKMYYCLHQSMQEKVLFIQRSYNESIALSNENNFVNIAGRYSDGDQRWLDRNLSNTGCGVVAAANIVSHMSRYVSGCGSLYRYNDLSVSSFVNHMYDIDKYLHPSAIAVFLLVILKRI